MRFETNIVGLRKITTDWETLQPGKRATQSRSAVNEDSGTPKDYVDYRGAARRARRRTPASGVHINFDRQLRVTTDRRIASAILDFRCSLSRRDNIRGAHDDLDIDSGSAADVRRGFGSRPLRAVALAA
jgi:hypothetical protein